MTQESFLRAAAAADEAYRAWTAAPLLRERHHHNEAAFIADAISAVVPPPLASEPSLMALACTVEVLSCAAPTSPRAAWPWPLLLPSWIASAPEWPNCSPARTLLVMLKPLRSRPRVKPWAMPAPLRCWVAAIKLPCKAQSRR